MIARTVGAGIVGLGLIGGVVAVVYNSDGTATVKVKDKKTGVEQTVRLYDNPGGKTYHCPPGTDDKLSPHDIRAGRIKLTLRQIRRQERKLEARYPDHTAPAPVADRFNALLRRDDRLVSAYNRTVDTRNAILKADCD